VLLLEAVRTALGVLLANTGRQDEAITAWHRALAVDPQSLDALYNLTVNLARMGRIGEARRFGEQYLGGAPPFLQADIAVIRQIVGR